MLSSRSEACPCGAMLVGSVPLGDSREVFTRVTEQIGPMLRRLPDGETGVRANWIGWQRQVFSDTDGLQSEIVDLGYIKAPMYFIAEGKQAAHIQFPKLGYAQAALASWQIFSDLQAKGIISKRLRFQVSLPTPLAPIQSFVRVDTQSLLEPLYEAQMFAELDEILATIPHERLAIQWDTALEFAILEGVMRTFLKNPEADIYERLQRLGNRIPPQVQLGFHLCYGDAGHKHFKEPADASKLVAVANHLTRHLHRPLNWVHMPVPRNRDDDAYFLPMRDLKLASETELYLGLVHLSDGTEGAQRRIAAAKRHVERFGVATECGFGRRPAETIQPLLALHGAVTAPVN